LGSGLYELKIHLGRGIRVYFINSTSVLVILLYGGDKTNQKEDIIQARKLKKTIGG
jgi:putative addiction module killer protein